MTENVHSAAQQGFSRSGQLYESGRADYPSSAIQHLVSTLRVTGESKILDLAAGTGKFTRQIGEFTRNIVAVEPVATMRYKLAEQLPDVEVRDGTAEQIPSSAGSFDCVFVATAFHWFDAPTALKEIHRVLTLDGSLGLIWNSWNEDKNPAWLKEIRALTEPFGQNAPRYKTMEWKRPFDESTLFSPLQFRSFEHPVKLNIEGVCRRILSISFISALPQTRFDQVQEELRGILNRYAPADGIFEMPYQTDAYWCRKL